jgi:hypothetical protein
LLAGLLTPELRAFDSSLFLDVLKKVAEKLDVHSRTTIFVNLLRAIEAFDHSDRLITYRIIKYINLWYELDIGGLGTDVTRSTHDIYKYDWPAITAEAIEWYDSEYEASDANSLR